MTASLGPLLVEAADPVASARFWTAAIGEPVCRERLVFRAESGPKIVKNRVHVDVHVRDPSSLLALRARVLAEYLPERLTMADVDGNEFCAFIDPEMAPGAPAKVFAVCIDSDRPEELAQWWAPLVGADIGPGPDGTMRWLYGAARWPEVVCKFVRVSDERLREETAGGEVRVVPNRWSWSVAGDADALTGFVDPDGNEFSREPSVRLTGEESPSTSAQS